MQEIRMEVEKCYKYIQASERWSDHQERGEPVTRLLTGPDLKMATIVTWALKKLKGMTNGQFSSIIYIAFFYV